MESCGNPLWVAVLKCSKWDAYFLGTRFLLDSMHYQQRVLPERFTVRFCARIQQYKYKSLLLRGVSVLPPHIKLLDKASGSSIIDFTIQGSF